MGRREGDRKEGSWAGEKEVGKKGVGQERRGGGGEHRREVGVEGGEKRVEQEKRGAEDKWRTEEKGWTGDKRTGWDTRGGGGGAQMRRGGDR